MQANTYYENSDYHFSYVMPSDYQSSDSVGGYQKKGGSVRIAEFATTDPVFSHAIYQLKKYPAELPGQEIDLMLPNDSIIESVRFWIKDSLPQLVVRFRNGTKDFELRAVGNRESAGSIVGEYTPIIGSIRVGKDYINNELLINPYDLAEPYAYNTDSSVNYLQPILVLEGAEPNYSSTTDRFTYVQAIASYRSRISNALPLYLDEFYSTGYFARTREGSIGCSASKEAALEELYKLIGDSRIVLINENHLDSRGRLLLQLLLPGLREKGFTAIGFEGLWEPGDSLTARGFPISTSGFYTKDPRFSNLLRETIRQGFSVFGYDHFATDRELNQALNIKQYLDRTNAEKIVVLAGFGHIHEGGTRRRMMASLLDSLLDVDPLTIDQVELVRKCPDSPLSLATSAVLEGKAIEVDAYVSNHLSDADLYDLLPVNYSLRNISSGSYPIVIEVYAATEAANPMALPVKVVQVEQAAENQNFSLWKGTYHVRVKNRYGDELRRNTIHLP